MCHSAKFLGDFLLLILFFFFSSETIANPVPRVTFPPISLFGYS